MTRINCVPVEELNDKHLLAEYRELPRIFALAKYTYDAPKQYVLGTGHMKFFYDKLTYLVKRQIQLVAELNKRGVRTTFNGEALSLHHVKNGGKLNERLWNDWEPDERAMTINRARLAERNAGIKYSKALGNVYTGA